MSQIASYGRSPLAFRAILECEGERVAEKGASRTNGETRGREEDRGGGVTGRSLFC
jgi:hypothetical protein